MTTCVNWASSTEDSIRAELGQALASGAYEAIERSRFRWLWFRIPEQYKDRDDIAAQIRMYSLEALNLFEPERGVSFSTFLTHHLRLKTQNWQQYLWQRSAHAKTGATITLSSLAGGFDDDNGGDIFSGKPALSRSREHRRYTDLATPSMAENHAKLGEVMTRLSVDARDTIDKLLAYPHQDRLLSMLGSMRYRAWLKQHLELTDQQITELYEEVRRKLPRYL